MAELRRPVPAEAKTGSTMVRSSPNHSMVPLDGEKDIGEARCGLVSFVRSGAAPIPFGSLHTERFKGRWERDANNQVQSKR